MAEAPTIARFNPVSDVPGTMDFGVWTGHRIPDDRSSWHPLVRRFYEYWRSIAEDYHWHIEILPIVEQRSKSYSIKEVYFNGTLPEDAAERLRQLDPGSQGK